MILTLACLKFFSERFTKIEWVCVALLEFKILPQLACAAGSIYIVVLVLGKHSNQNHKIPHFRQRLRKGQTGICPICEASYPKQSELNRHIRRVHEGKKLPYECSDCEFDTLQEKLLEKHMVTCKGNNSIIEDTHLFNEDFEVINESDQENVEMDQENIEIDQKNQEIDQENQGIDQDIEDIPMEDPSDQGYYNTGWIKDDLSACWSYICHPKRIS